MHGFAFAMYLKRREGVPFVLYSPTNLLASDALARSLGSIEWIVGIIAIRISRRKLVRSDQLVHTLRHVRGGHIRPDEVHPSFDESADEWC